MTVPEYIENLNRLKQVAIDNWEVLTKELTEVERQIFDSSFDWLIDNLEIKKGEIKVDEKLSSSMDRFLSAVIKIVNENKGYESKLTNFLADLKTIQRNNKEFHATAFNFDIETAGVKGVQKTVVNEIINQYLDNGLNAHFAAPLRDNIFRNILAGANMKQVREVLRNYILSGQDESGKLGRYLHNTAMMAVDSYTGKINQQLMVEFDFTGLIISGSLIETSSKQCIYAVEESDRGYFSMKDWETVLEIARNNKKALLIEGTTVKNLPLNKLHWGCRHDFTPVIKGAIEKDLPKVEKKEEPKAEIIPPKEYAPATSIKEGRDQLHEIFGKKLGLKVGSVESSSLKGLGVDKMNKYIQTLNELANTYKISEVVVENNRNTDIYFDSTMIRDKGTPFGFVQPSDHYKSISEINFGDKTDSRRSLEVDPRLAHLMEKSRVDKDNLEMATAVHEFGHVISINGQSYYNQGGVKEFWKEMLQVRNEYADELNAMVFQKDKGYGQKFLDIYLGQYASTDINEFMAEGFTEYRLRSNPSKYAKKIGLLIDKYFKK